MAKEQDNHMETDVPPSLLRTGGGKASRILKILAGALLAYLHPGRFAPIDDSFSFPFPAGMKK